MPPATPGRALQQQRQVSARSRTPAEFPGCGGAGAVPLCTTPTPAPAPTPALTSHTALLPPAAGVTPRGLPAGCAVATATPRRDFRY